MDGVEWDGGVGKNIGNVGNGLSKNMVYDTLLSYLPGKSTFHNVSTQACFDMSLFPLKTLDWLIMTSTSAPSLSLHWSLS